MAVERAPCRPGLTPAVPARSPAQCWDLVRNCPSSQALPLVSEVGTRRWSVDVTPTWKVEALRAGFDKP